MTNSITRTAASLGRMLAVSVLALGVTSTAALANFRGGGAMFAFTEACQQPVGWGPDAVVTVQARYVDTAIPLPDGAQRMASEMSIAIPAGALNLSRWQASFVEGGPTEFLGATGRGIFSQFAFHRPRPRFRVVLNRVVSRIDPAGPDTLQNARSVVVRLRVQNLFGVQGCAATVTAAMRRA
ncbi:MAG: hypothetical protein JJU19_05750 [Pararhodobacter sp.]|nr:hypothetical protein [Pararhodobacter sp.]